MDRRKRKSRKAIFDACVELSKEKDFQNMTVNEIVDRADLNRGTFYLHFADKFDMMNSFEDEMIEKIKDVLVNNIPKENFDKQFIQSRYNTVVYILKCYEENKELVQLLMSSSHSTSFQTKLRETLKRVLVDKIFPKLEINALTIPTDLFIIFFTSISLNLAEYTYQSEEPINNEYLAKFLINVIFHGPAKTLGLIVDNNLVPSMAEDEFQLFVKQFT
ncbi:TetR/AcrR family transcriptional regulator [Bacillus massiliigorillae]|uniref:TetR/AcrR family transcriptional regulator n=1 Tax=Bacillus massiliigorillae TaxID=1243664 RepID=UPI00039BF656|nr:TetR/AcrR family transcriptional regulator [Bacillus massiliigorillae]